jgi:hypothetical protein
VYRKDEITMKKLLALFIIGGLLSTITGCPPSSTTPTSKKGTTESIQQKKSGGDADKKSDTGPKMDEKKSDTGPKMDEKKSPPDKGGTKKDETKTEEKKK